MTGVAFQSFFAEVMEVVYGSDYVKIKPYGSLGDKGCDGYLQSTGSVFACYGAQNGAAGTVAALLSKMNDDFDSAKLKLSKIMKCWCMTHNIVEGLPTDALELMQTFKDANTGLEFEFHGQPRFVELFSQMTDVKRESFLGATARNKDFIALQMDDVRALVSGIMASIDGSVALSTPIEPVSPKKLDHNKIPQTWASVIASGRMNSGFIDQYFDAHPDPMCGEQVAQKFRNKYQELKLQKLEPGAIMLELYVFIAGPDNLDVTMQVAAHSLLAYLFESCDIFENAPTELASS